MSQLHPLKVLNSSHLSEKASLAIQNANSYVFKVSSSANKLQVKKAIESLYKVEVEKVNILKQRDSSKSFIFWLFLWSPSGMGPPNKEV